MKVCAILCEYNPLHRGHAYQIAQARVKSCADYVVCLMSGPFVQRGEPAVADKWTRTQAALMAGVDLVIELPSLFALRAAQDFAFGGMSLMHSLSVVTHVSFGAETGELEKLLPLLQPETEQQSARLYRALKDGNSYPRAVAISRAQALERNDLLAVEYLRALKKLESPIEPVCIPRLSEGKGGCSSSQIRSLLQTDVEAALALCPEESAALTREALLRQDGAAQMENIEALLLNNLRRLDAAALSACPGMDEGLENRVLAAAQQASDLNELLSLIKTKRYTMARIKRGLLHALLGNTKQLLREHPAPEFARVLGFRESALPLLQELGRSSRVPLILRPAKWKKDPLYRRELAAQDLWGLCQGDPAFRRAGSDLTQPLVKL